MLVTRQYRYVAIDNLVLEVAIVARGCHRRRARARARRSEREAQRQYGERTEAERERGMP